MDMGHYYDDSEFDFRVVRLLYSKHHINNTCNWLLFIGGFGSAFVYFLMTSASIYHAINWLSTLQFTILQLYVE